MFIEACDPLPHNPPRRELGGGGDVRVTERDLDSLTLHESPQMITGEQDKTTRELLSEAHGCLPQIQAEVIAAVKRSCFTSQALQRSRLDRAVDLSPPLQWERVCKDRWSIACTVGYDHSPLRSVVQGSSKSQSPQN